jgi:hypothetical protein
MGLLTKFNITESHLKLLQHINMRYNDEMEFGAPEVDPKRPYGNSDVYNDMVDMLGLDPKYNRDGEMPDETYIELKQLHKEMETVLQIICKTLQVSEGLYKKDSEYSSDWYKVEVVNEVV